MFRSVLIVLLWSTAAWAQDPALPELPPAVTPRTAVAAPATGAGGLVETDPIRCWWRTSAGAVRLGERFQLTLTCAVLDDDAIQVVPDESRLASSVVQLAPFEVVDGSHPADLGRGTRRFFQYHYTLRIISPDAVGQDVSLPSFSIAYRVNSRLPGNSSQQGRELSYVLPPLAVRVLSTVPEEAPDIRDSAGVDFGRLESLAFRAGFLRLLGWAFIALGGIMTLLAFVALAASRVAAAGALGTLVHQATPAPDEAAEPGEGRLLAHGRLPRSRATLVSASVTPEDIARGLQRMGDRSPGRRQQLEDARAAMATFAGALYSATPKLDRSALDEALGQALALARGVRSELNAPGRLLRQWLTRAPEVEQRA